MGRRKGGGRRRGVGEGVVERGDFFVATAVVGPSCDKQMQCPRVVGDPGKSFLIIPAIN